jgi:polyphosphate kinase
MNVLGCYQFRVTRNSDLFVDEEEVKNLRTALQGELPQRHFGDAVRLEIADNCSQPMADFLLQQFAARTTTTSTASTAIGQPGAPDAGARPGSTAPT